MYHHPSYSFVFQFAELFFSFENEFFMENLVKNVLTLQRNVASSKNLCVFIFTAPKSMELITVVKLVWD